LRLCPIIKATIENPLGWPRLGIQIINDAKQKDASWLVRSFRLWLRRLGLPVQAHFGMGYSAVKLAIEQCGAYWHCSAYAKPNGDKGTLMTLVRDQILQNRYRVVSLLHQGGMRSVYRAWDTCLRVPIALKEMIPQPGLDQQTLTQLRHQFQVQAMVLARLSHPHIVRVTDFFEEGGNVFMVMNFVEGESLAERIERQGTLPVEEVLVWANQLLDALAYCHGQGVIHRDIEPQSIIIRSDGQAVLVGFGPVKLWDPNDPHTRTPVREMGAPEYVSPEQHMGHTDPRSDIYGLGATIYHALTGQAPPTATMRIASPGIFQPLRALNPHISSATEVVVLRAMELSPEHRFHTAQEMAVALGVERIRGQRLPASGFLAQILDKLRGQGTDEKNTG
jgi:serine/threonine-protein kinase